jgi:hypothetical protein
VQILKLLVTYSLALHNVLSHHRHFIVIFLDKNLSSLLHGLHLELLDEILLRLELEVQLLDLSFLSSLFAYELLILAFVALQHKVELQDLSLKLYLLIGCQRFLDIPQIQVAGLGRGASSSASSPLLGLLLQELNLVF